MFNPIPEGYWFIKETGRFEPKGYIFLMEDERPYWFTGSTMEETFRLDEPGAIPAERVN